MENTINVKVQTQHITRTYYPNKSKFNSYQDVVDYLIAIGIKVTVQDSCVLNGVDLETVKKFSK